MSKPPLVLTFLELGSVFPPPASSPWLYRQLQPPGGQVEKWQVDCPENLWGEEEPLRSNFWSWLYGKQGKKKPVITAEDPDIYFLVLPCLLGHSIPSTSYYKQMNSLNIWVHTIKIYWAAAVYPTLGIQQWTRWTWSLPSWAYNLAASQPITSIILTLQL